LNYVLSFLSLVETHILNGNVNAADVQPSGGNENFLIGRDQLKLAAEKKIQEVRLCLTKLRSIRNTRGDSYFNSIASSCISHAHVPFDHVIMLETLDKRVAEVKTLHKHAVGGGFNHKTK
jgi:hypothetical protein